MSRLITYQESVNLTTEQCICGIVFGLPERIQQDRRNDGGTFYCPMGHPLSYTKPKIKELQDKLDAAERLMRAAKCEALNAQAKQVEAEKKLAQQTKRVCAGVCPCCSRTFTNLARHMATKHKQQS